MKEVTMATRILVWDIPTRVFHWLLAGSFIGAFVTAESEMFRDVHVALGYLLLALIGFRILWGIVGTRYARFSAFAFGPSKVLTYLKSLLTGSPQHYLGHNPAGSWVIYALLLLGVLAGATGYATYNEIGGEWFEELHEAFANSMLALVGVHVAGVVVSSLLHRENLVKSMINGYKQGDAHQGVRGAYWLLGAGLLAGTVVLWSGIL
jgi:cytochrome b